MRGRKNCLCASLFTLHISNVKWSVNASWNFMPELGGRALHFFRLHLLVSLLSARVINTTLLFFYSVRLLLLSHFTCVRLCATPSLGFSRQEHWGGLPFPSPMHESEKWKVKSLSHIWLFATPWTAAHQAPPFMGFSRQEDWSGVPLPLDGQLFSIGCFFYLWMFCYTNHNFDRIEKDFLEVSLYHIFWNYFHCIWKPLLIWIT